MSWTRLASTTAVAGIVAGIILGAPLAAHGAATGSSAWTSGNAAQTALARTKVYKSPDNAGFLGGVIEGYYGPPWSANDTLHMIDFLGAHHLNAFVYAPKDDPYQRDKWNLLYPSAKLNQIKALVQHANQANVNFIYSISPGLTITYSSAKDRAALLRKVNQLRSIGIHTFMISFDDVYHGLNPTDGPRYHHDRAFAQSSLSNWLLAQERKQDKSFRLILTPQLYRGMTDSPYWESLKVHLNHAVDVIWTGPKTITDTITGAQVKTVEGFIGHKLVIWDNYPVNDYTYITDHHPQLYMGPVVGRTSDVPKLVAGYLFNPMLQERASEVAIWTGSDYLNHPAQYKPAVSWHHALDSIGGPAKAAFTLFAEDSSSYYRHDDPPAALTKDVDEFWASGAKDPLSSKIYGDFLAMSKADAELAKGLPDPELYGEIHTFTELLSEKGQAGLVALQVLADEQQHKSTTTDVERLNALLAIIAKNDEMVAGNVVTTFGEKVIQTTK